MAYIHLFAVVTLVVAALCYRGMNRVEKKPAAGWIPGLLFGVAFLLRIVCVRVSKGFYTDISCFSAWAARIWEVGPRGFYSPEVFTDYPPGLLYYLYLVGGLCAKLHIPHFSQTQLFLLKLPAVLSDMACGGLIYREAKARRGDRVACFLAAAYLFQPAVILNSAIWGQVDSVLTLALLVMCLMLMKGNFQAAYLAFGLGVLLKPQMLVFTPVVLVAVLDQVFLKDFSWRKLATHCVYGLETVAGMLILCLPFGLGKVFAQYFDTLGEYPYAAVNACNFWGLLGKNWIRQEESFGFLSYRGWGIVVILGIVFFAFFFSLKRGRDAQKYPLLAAFIILTMFLFSVRMHERYLYPGFAMLLLAYLYWPRKGLYLCYGGFIALGFYNMAWVLYFYDPSNYDRKNPLFMVVSAGMLVCAALLYYMIICWCGNRRPTVMASGHGRGLGNGQEPVRTIEHWESAFLSGANKGFTRTDILVVLALTIVYAAFALVNLGERKAPTTVYEMTQGEKITLEFAEPPASFFYYIAPKQERDFRLKIRANAQVHWIQDVQLDDVFSWQEIKLENLSTEIGFVLQSERASIIELCFKDEAGNSVLPLNADQYETLFDEQELCPERSSYRNSMYFDEIYHGRTAYEYLHGMRSYENTHPPLGKIFIAAGIALFGMNPFGWRIAGTLLGILMVPVAYLFGKRFVGNAVAASLVAALFAFDFMHFTQTRIATIDVFVTFFVMLMYFFMYRYVSENMGGSLPSKNSLSPENLLSSRKLLPLALCGICMGLGVASKWTGVYAGSGLAVLFFLCLFWQYGKMEKTVFWRQTLKLIGFCLVFFVLIPAVIYLMSYLPFEDEIHEGLVQKMLYNQKTMFDYHSKLESTHPFSSPWYLWPLIVRPVWYYSGVVDESIREGISALGNPLVWWMGIPALAYMLWRVFRHRDGKALFLVISYAAQYLPWMFVSRLTFIYHYFPSVIFVVLMVVYSLHCVTEGLLAGRLGKMLGARGRYLFPACALVYALMAFGLFLLFYPVLSGAPVSLEFVRNWLRWGKDWYFVSNRMP